jgi:hypothetical protein
MAPIKTTKLVSKSPRILGSPKTITLVDFWVFKLSCVSTVFVSQFSRNLLLSLFQVSERDSGRSRSSIYRESFQKGILTQIFLILNSFPTKKNRRLPNFIILTTEEMCLILEGFSRAMKWSKVQCTRSPFLTLLPRRAQSGRWSSFGKRVWFTETRIV